MSEDTEQTDPGETREIVTFQLADQDFCMDIMDIREIRSWTAPTPLPHSPDYVRGLINLRGAVLPIIDLARRLDIERPDETERDVIIVAMIGTQLAGLVVDSVSDIITVPQSDFQSAPPVGNDGARSFIGGILALEERMIRLVDLDHILGESHGEAA